MQIAFIFLAFSIFISALGYQTYYSRKQGYYRYPDKGWMSVKEYPIPEDIRGYLATDGNRVEYLYCAKWGPHGKVIMSEYDKTFVTYWQPLPEAPRDDK